MSNLATLLAMIGRDRLAERYLAGEDDRGAGLVYEVENPGLKQYFNKALWFPLLLTFIGENERGDHVRVRYFPARALPPPAADDLRLGCRVGSAGGALAAKRHGNGEFDQIEAHITRRRAGSRGVG